MGFLTWIWLISPCQTFGTVLTSFLHLRAMTATLLRRPLLNPHRTWHYLHTGKRRSFAKALVLQQQTHHFLPCKHLFCYRSLSLLTLLPFHPQKLYLAIKIPEPVWSNRGSLLWCQKERKEIYEVQAGCVQAGMGTGHQATTYLWLESESLRSLLQNFHCFTVGNSAREQQQQQKSLR